MPSSFTEQTYEEAIVELFENMGYEHIYAPDLERDYTSPFLDSVLADSLVRLNNGLPKDALDEALICLRDLEAGSLLQKNARFTNYLQNGITVKSYENNEERSLVVKLIDYKDIKKNTFYVVNQFTFIENGIKHRHDVIVFINELPFVLMVFKI